MERMSLFSHYQTMGREGIVFQFKGSMSQALLVKFGDMIREDLFSSSRKLSEIRTVFSVFIELAQNIYRYSAERSDAGLEKDAGSGIVLVSECEDRYTVASGNQIANDRLAVVVERLRAMDGVPADSLKRMYREQLKAPPPPGSVGAGLGLYDIAKRSGGGLSYSIHPVNDEVSFIELFVDIRKGTDNG